MTAAGEVWVVDDDHSIRWVLERALVRAGFGVRTFAQVDEVLAALAVSDGQVERGIFIDGVGYGSALIANKIPGVYAAVAQDPFCAGLARSHSNTNVLCLGGKIIGSAIAQEIVKTWMTTDYLADNPRYTQRVDKVVAIAAKHTTK